MEFLKVVRQRTFLSELLYVALNVALIISVLILVRITESPVPAIGLVVLSKWRVFAVRPRYWWANIQSNLVDYIVGVSFASFIYSAYVSDAASGEKTMLVFAIMILYAIWLLFIRTKARRSYIVAQAFIALFNGMTLLFMLAYALPLTVVVLLSWMLGYATSRHILSTYEEEPHIVLLSQIWGLFVAELSWLAYHWTVAYNIFNSEVLALPRFALTMLCLGFVVFKAYDSYYHNGKVRMGDIIMPLLFTVGIIVVLPLVLSLLGLSISVGI